MPRVRVALAAAIQPGEARFFAAGGQSVVIVRDEDEFFAVDGVCPHKGFELDHALALGGCVECPWHGYRYDLRSGVNVYPGRVYLGDIARPPDPIAVYPLEVVDGEIWVELPERS